MFEHLPYTNFHELNADWIISVVKEFEDHYTGINEAVDAGIAQINAKAAEKQQDLIDTAAEKLELLNDWYTQHQSDIADDLATALASLNAAYTQKLAEFTTAAQLVGDEVIASIPSDYTALVGRVSTLESSDALISDDNLFDPDTIYANKAINSSTGSLYNAQGYYVSEYIAVTPGKKYLFMKDGAIALVNFLGEYSSSKTFVRCITIVLGEITIPENVYYIRVNPSYGGIPVDNLTVKEASLRTYMQGTAMLVNGGEFPIDTTIIKDNGAVVRDVGYTNYKTSNYIPLKLVAGKTVVSAPCYPNAQVNAIAFYDEDYTLIGTPYVPEGVVSGQIQPIDVPINAELLVQYPGAVYCRVGYYGPYQTHFAESSVASTNKDYFFNLFNKICCGGDSVTAGFVCEGTAQNPQQIYEVIPNASYPANINKNHALATVDNNAISGLTAVQYYETVYPDVDFSEYDLVLIELGLNTKTTGSITISDINTPGTNTYALNQIIAGIRSQNSGAYIGVIRSQYYLNTSTALQAYQAIASNNGAHFIDLHDTRYLDLANTKYHGYYNDSGTAKIDYAHFTRAGYCAKAYVIEKLIEETLG